MKLKHYKALDGVRAIAALMVMFFHFFKDVEAKNGVLVIIKKYSVFGQTGVSLFFVLSGFLISRILLNTKQSPTYFINFYIRRALRIFPLYYLYLIIFYFILPFLEKNPIVPFDQQLAFWIYLQNIAATFNWDVNGPQHFWSLAVEEHFYLFWPFLIYFLDKNKIKIAIFVLIVLAFITRILLIKNNLGVFYFTLSRMDELAIGAFLAILEIEGKLISANSKKFLLLFCLVLLPTVVLWIFTSNLGMVSVQISKFILFAFCYFGLIGFIITAKESFWIKKILNHKALTYTGKISYGLYVYHPMCFLLLNEYFIIDSVFLLFILSFSFCFLTASLSFYLFESKFLVLKKNFENNYAKLKEAAT
ncbi:MAG: acyltransferase [Ferruginibacter sp.]